MRETARALATSSGRNSAVLMAPCGVERAYLGPLSDPFRAQMVRALRDGGSERTSELAF